MMTDFDDIGVRDIRRVPARFNDDSGTVYFVATTVRITSDAVRGDEKRSQKP